MELEHPRSGEDCPVGWSLLCVWLLISFILLDFGRHCWPVLDGDSIAFLPPMLSYAKGEGLVNRAWAGASVLDLTGRGRMVYHGFLYPMVVGTLTPKPTYPSVILTMTVFEVLTLAGCALLFYRIFAFVSNRRAWWHVVLLALSTTGVTTTLVGLRGRPEPFAMLILVWGCNLLFILPWRWHWLVAGASLGLLGVTHPAGAVLAGLAAALYGSLRQPAKVWVVWVGKLCLAFLLPFWLGVAWYPFGFREWIRGLLRHSKIAVLPGWRVGTLYYWFLAPSATFYGFLFLLGLGAGIYLHRQHKARIQSRWLFRLFCALLAAAACFYGLRTPSQNYNLHLLTPLVCALIIAAMLTREETRRKLSPAWLERLAVLGVLALSSLGFFQRAAVFPFFLRHGMTYEQARSLFERWRGNLPGPVSAGWGMYTLADDYCDLSFHSGHPTGVAAAFFQQANSGLLSPPKWPDYELVQNYFCPMRPRFLGLPLGNTLAGYNFAIYRSLARGHDLKAPSGHNSKQNEGSPLARTAAPSPGL